MNNLHGADASLAKVGRGLLSGPRTTQRPADPASYVRESHISRAPGDVLDFCMRGRGFQAILPNRLTLLDGDDCEFRLGGTYAFRWWLGNVVPVRWVAYIDHLEPGREFSDLQIRGVFRYFHHTHTCEPDGDGTRYTDRIEYATALGGFLDRKLVRRELDRVFRLRHKRMRQLLEVR